MVQGGPRWPNYVLVALGVAALVGAVAAHVSLVDPSVYHAGTRALLLHGTPYTVRVGPYGFTYPPFAALIFLPFAWLSRYAVFVVMTIVSAASLVRFIRSVLPGSGARLRAGGWVTGAGLAVLLVCQPLVSDLGNGQVDLLLAALVLHDLLAARRGVLIGLSVAVKLTPAVFVVYVVACGRWREAGRAAMVALGATAACGVLLPSASWRYWTHVVESGDGVGKVARVGNQSVRGVAAVLMGVHAATLLWAAVAVPLLVLGVAVARTAALAGHEVLGAGIAGVTSCVVSPVAWTHHWVWCVPLLVGVWQLGTTASRIGAAGLAALFIHRTVEPVSVGRAIGARELGCGYATAVVLALAVAGVAVVARSATLHSTGGSAKPEVGTHLL